MKPRGKLIWCFIFMLEKLLVFVPLAPRSAPLGLGQKEGKRGDQKK